MVLKKGGVGVQEGGRWVTLVPCLLQPALSMFSAVYFPSLLLTPLFAIAWSIVFFGYLPLFRDKLPGYIATGSIMLYLFLALK